MKLQKRLLALGLMTVVSTACENSPARSWTGHVAMTFESPDSPAETSALSSSLIRKQDCGGGRTLEASEAWVRGYMPSAYRVCSVNSDSSWLKVYTEEDSERVICVVPLMEVDTANVRAHYDTKNGVRSIVYRCAKTLKEGLGGTAPASTLFRFGGLNFNSVAIVPNRDLTQLLQCLTSPGMYCPDSTARGEVIPLVE